MKVALDPKSLSIVDFKGFTDYPRRLRDKNGLDVESAGLKAEHLQLSK